MKFNYFIILLILKFKVEETFYQDSVGQINETQKTEAYDTPDIAPFRYRQEPIPPTSPLVSRGSISDKVGHLEPNRNERRPVSIIKKPVQMYQVKSEESKLLKHVSVITEESYSESSSSKRESIVAEVLKHSALNSAQLSVDEMRHMSYNQAIASKQIEREAGVVRNLVENLSASTKDYSNLNISNISENSEEYDSVSTNLSKQTSNASDLNSYGIRNLVTGDDKRSQTLPSIY